MAQSTPFAFIAQYNYFMSSQYWGFEVRVRSHFLNILSSWPFMTLGRFYEKNAFFDPKIESKGIF